MELCLTPLEPPPDAAVLSQNLLIQTPLQDVLASILDRLGSQYRCILELQDQLKKERLARDLLQDKIDFVVKRTEDGNKALTDDVLRKFEQRLLEVTKATEACGENSKQALSKRISYVEEKLEGAENLGGHCQALHDMCAILGMKIPQGRPSETSGQLGGRSNSPYQLVQLRQQQPALFCGGLPSSTAAASLGPIREESGGIADEGVPAAASEGTGADAVDPPLPAAAPEDDFTAAASSATSSAEGPAPSPSSPQCRPAVTSDVGPAAVACAQASATSQCGPSAASGPFVGDVSHTQPSAALACVPLVTRGASMGAEVSSQPAVAWRRSSGSSNSGRRQPLALAQEQQQEQEEGMQATPNSRPLAGTRTSADPNAAEGTPVGAEEAEDITAVTAAGSAGLRSGRATMPAALNSASVVSFKLASSVASVSEAPAPAELAGGVQPDGGPAAVSAEAEAVYAIGPHEEAPAIAITAPAQRVASPSMGDSRAEQGMHPAGESSSAVASMLRSKSPAVRTVADVVNMLRRRPAIQQTGLLWKLQASLHDTVLEQERLKSEVESLRSQLELTQQSTTDSLHSCHEHIDAVEDKVQQVEAMVAVLRDREVAQPNISFADLKVLEDKVNFMNGQVADGAARIVVIEEQLNTLNASETASSLLSPDQDSLAVLQSHLLSQQQKLQKYMDSLAGNIANSIPGHVHSAVNATVMEISRSLERRLGDRLASKQDIQALSIRVSSKITRDEVERMLRKVQQSIPQSHAPASGTRLKCISCDSDLQPVIFASAPGGGPATADLRYSQLPSVSPPRQPNLVPQPRPVSPTSGLPSMQHSAAGSRACSAAPSRRAGLGAPIAWLHQMRRDTNGSYLGQATGRQTGGGGADGCSWDGAAAGPAAEPGTAASPQDALLVAEGSGAGRRLSSNLLQLGALMEVPPRPHSRDSVLGVGERRKTAASVDEVALSSRSSKLALPALGLQGGSPSKAVLGTSASPSKASLIGSPSATLAAEASLTVQPAVVHRHQQQHQQTHLSPPAPKPTRPVTAAPPHKVVVAAPSLPGSAPPEDAIVGAATLPELPSVLQGTADLCRLPSQLHAQPEPAAEGEA